MCRELNREPAWVGAIRLALTQGCVDVDSVVEEANLVPGCERTVRDVLSTMAERGLLTEGQNFEATGRYFPGSVLQRSAPSPSAIEELSDRGVHRWQREGTD